MFRATVRSRLLKCCLVMEHEIPQVCWRLILTSQADRNSIKARRLQKPDANTKSQQNFYRQICVSEYVQFQSRRWSTDWIWCPTDERLRISVLPSIRILSVRSWPFYQGFKPAKSSRFCWKLDVGVYGEHFSSANLDCEWQLKQYIEPQNVSKLSLWSTVKYWRCCSSRVRQ